MNQKTELSAPRSFDPIIGTKTKQILLDFFSENPEKEFSVQELHDRLGIPESSTSVNLDGLKRAGILELRKDGRFSLYKLNSHYAEVFSNVFSSLETVFHWTLSARKGRGENENTHNTHRRR